MSERRSRAWLDRVRAPSAIAGACLGFGFAAIEGNLGARLAGALFGGLYGVVVGALVRCFRVTPGMYPLVGAIAGPVPLAFLSFDLPKDERGGVWALSALLGLVIGCIEWGHRRALDAAPSRAQASRPADGER